MPITMPTPEERARSAEHWRKVREGLHTPEPAPQWDTKRDAVAHHRYLASQLIERAAWHARQAIEAAN